MITTHEKLRLGKKISWTLMQAFVVGAFMVLPASGASVQKKTGVPPQRQSVAYYYNPKGRIDPFTPLIPPEAAAKNKNDKARILPLNPLQRQGIDQFRLVGIVESERGRRAMVQDPSGKFYSLLKGTRIGLYQGRVESILKGSVIIRERYVTDEGNVVPRKQIMKLHQNEVIP